jgi:hypothetical protein
VKAGANKTLRTKAKPPSDVVEWDLLENVNTLSPVQLRSVANVYDRFAEQCRRLAVMRENKLPEHAGN